MVGTGSPEFFEPIVKNIIGSAAMNYITEDNIMLHFAINQLDAEKIAIAYHNDDSGIGRLDNVKNILKHRYLLRR